MPLPTKPVQPDYSVEMSEKNGEVGEGVGDEVARRTPRESSSAMSRCLLGAWKRWLKDGGEP